MDEPNMKVKEMLERLPEEAIFNHRPNTEIVTGLAMHSSSTE